MQKSNKGAGGGVESRESVKDMNFHFPILNTVSDEFRNVQRTCSEENRLYWLEVKNQKLPSVDKGCANVNVPYMCPYRTCSSALKRYPVSSLARKAALV